MRKNISILLAVIMILAVLAPASAFKANAAVSTHVFMIVTNPGENCNTEMNINFFSEWDYTKCFVEYTVASDSEFANKKTATTTYSDEAYPWFYGHATTMAGTIPYNVKFHDWDVCLKGLTPDTEYIYRVADGNGLYSKTYKFKTSGADEFSILWLSDAHVFSGYASRLKDWVATYDYIKGQTKYPIGFQFSTGDTVACGDRIKDWLSVTKQEFASDMMLANIVGNHDVYDSVMTKDPNYVQYWKSSEYFKYVYNNPKNAYTQTSQRLVAYLANDKIEDPDGSKSFEDVNGKSYWFLYNRCLFIMFDYWTFNYNSIEVANAFNWASQVIADNEGNYDYLICADHLNLINGGGGASRYYEQKYMSFLDQNNVDIFLAGDNHVYLRTGKLYNKQITDDPTKGTYIIQAPCISRAQSFSAKGPAGYALEQYSLANSENGGTVGGIVIDVNKEGMTFSCYVRENGEYSKYDEYTVPKKVRYTKLKEGRYETGADVMLKSSPSNDASDYVSVPAGTVVDIIGSTNGWGKIIYNGITGWISTLDITKKIGTNVAPKMPGTFKMDGVNKSFAGTHKIQTYTPEFGATIASGEWTFQYNTTITGVKDETGTYAVTVVNEADEAKRDTPIPENGAVILISKEYEEKEDLLSALTVGKHFVLDSVMETVYIVEDATGSAAADSDVVIKDGFGEYADGIVRGIPAGTKISAAKEGFATNVTFKNDKLQELDDNKYVGTGSVATNGEASVTFIVKGDTDGNGVVDATDYIVIKRHFLNVSKLEGNYFEAADMDGSEKIDSTDYIAIKRIILGLA